MARGDIALYKDDFAPTSVPIATLAALSQRIDRLNCDPRLAVYCRRYGVEFLGEALRLNFRGNKRMSDDREELGGELNGLELSFGNDPIALGWEPPYWTDREWLALLNLPAAATLDMYASRMRAYNIDASSRIGNLIRNMAGMAATDWMYFQRDFGRLRRGLRSGMIIPPCWQPTESIGES